MARPRLAMGTRQVVPRFWDHEELADLAVASGVAPDIRLTMIGLWAASDALGRFEWRPKMLAAKIYPYNSGHQATVEPAMNLFVQHGYLLKYDSDGKWYGAWPHWGEHNDFRKGVSEYPAPPGLLPRNPPQSPQNVNVNVKKNVENEIENESEGKSSQSHSQSLSHSFLHSGNSNPQSQSKPDNPKPATSPKDNPLPITVPKDKPQPRRPQQFPDLDDDELGDVDFGGPVTDSPAERLAALLYSVLPEEAQANAVNGWQRLWAGDFDELLQSHDDVQQIEKVIKALPDLKLGKFIVRAKVFVEKYPELLAAYRKVKR